MNKILIISLLILFIEIQAQIKSTNDFRVQSFSLSDRLDVSSIVDPEIGRYTAYDFDINSSDYFIVKVKSNDFVPYLLISSPKGNNIFAYPKNGKNSAILDTVANETGKWSLYVICDTSESGSFELKISFSDKKSYELPKANDVKTLLRYIIAHAEADFGFLISRCKSSSENKYISPIKFPQSIESIIDVNKKAYIITFYKGNDEGLAEKTYQSIKKSLKDNLDEVYINKEFTKSDIYSKFTKYSALKKPSVYLRLYKPSTEGTLVTIEVEPN